MHVNFSNKINNYIINHSWRDEIAKLVCVYNVMQCYILWLRDPAT